MFYILHNLNKKGFQLGKFPFFKRAGYIPVKACAWVRNGGRDKAVAISLPPFARSSHECINGQLQGRGKMEFRKQLY